MRPKRPALSSLGRAVVVSTNHFRVVCTRWVRLELSFRALMRFRVWCPTGAGGFRSLLQYWAAMAHSLHGGRAHQTPSVQQCLSVCRHAAAPACVFLVATGASILSNLLWASAGSRPTTTILTSRELHQEVGIWVAGVIASTEGKLAHLAAMSIAAALVQDCLHRWDPPSACACSTGAPDQLSAPLSTVSPVATLMHTTFLTHSKIPTARSPGGARYGSFGPGLGLPKPMVQLPLRPAPCPTTSV